MRKLTKINYIIYCTIGILLISCNSDKNKSKTYSSPTGYEVKVDSILSLMTLDEKLGQLNLPSAGQFTTGQATNSDIGGKIEKGLVGGLFNIKSVASIKEMQKDSSRKKPTQNSTYFRNGCHSWLRNHISNTIRTFKFMGYGIN